MHDVHSHVKTALKSLMKGVQTKGGEFEEDDLDDIVCPACLHPLTEPHRSITGR